MTTSRYVVIGAGLVGSSAAWALAERGHEVTLVERDRPAGRSGSSHGSARILRYTYPDAFYARLMVDARLRWHELERQARRRLVTQTGGLDFGVERDPAQLAGVLASAGVEHELLPLAQARTRWPQFAFDTDVLWHPAAAVADVETSVRAMVSLAQGYGAQVLTSWPVARVERSGAGHRVVSSTGEAIEAEKVVVAAGGWLPELLGSLGLPTKFLGALPPLEVRQEQIFHFPYRDPGAGWPTLIQGDHGFVSYSLPGGRDADFRGHKVALFNNGRVIGSGGHQDQVVDPAARAQIVAYVGRYFPGLVPEPYAETTCLFTNTPDEEFVIDEVDGITIVSPCSGHGAKFAPLTGELAADLASGVRRPPQRFQPCSSGS